MVDQAYEEEYVLELVSRLMQLLVEFSGGTKTKRELEQPIRDLRTELRTMIPSSRKSKYGGNGPQVGKGSPAGGI